MFTEQLVKAMLYSLLLLPYIGFTQERHCLFNRNQDLDIVPNHNVKTDARLEIPIVIHFLYDSESVLPSRLQIDAQIAALNRDFQGLGKEWRLLSPAVQKLVGNANIQFCLAHTDPLGQFTTGITYKESDISSLDDIYYTSRGGQDAWPTDKYLNIWVVDLIDGLLGSSSTPLEAGTKEDGVVINRRYFGTTNAQQPYQLGRTLVHEIGHYLGLSHPWGNLSGECIEDDGIADTPPQRGPHAACPPLTLEGCEEVETHWNFMDYTPDCCMAFFTQQQVESMRYVLSEYRSGLLDWACAFKTTKEALEVQISPNPAREVVSISWNALEYHFPVKFYLYSSEGKLLSSETLQEQQQQLNFCLNNYIQGILIGILEFSDHSRQSFKIIHAY